MDEKIKKEIVELVKSIFSEKEESSVRKRTEDALQASAQTIEDLTTALEVKNTEVSDISTQVDELTINSQDSAVGLDEVKAELEKTKEELSKSVNSVEEANAKVEEANSKVEEASAKVEELEKDKLVEKRMDELEKSGILRSDRNEQATKVRSLSDEEFTSYASELKSIREAVLAELEEAKLKDDKKSDGDKHADKSGDGKSFTPAADIDDKDSAKGSFNLELASDSDIAGKYQELGAAMADMFSNK